MHTYQFQFHREWEHLTDPHVRALAWILTSPDLLCQSSPIWWQQVGAIQMIESEKLKLWLSQLNAHPTPLHESLKIHQFLRLGHYAERLLSFYFNHVGLLYAQGLQVRNERSETIGEFDYLLYADNGLQHLELATKFYLFYGDESELGRASLFNYLGPNLNDSLGAKMQKIMQRQLTLSQHDAAKKLVSTRISSAKALIKGWLFYHSSERQELVDGIAIDHCKGFWWTMQEFEQLAIPFALKLDRLQWLAPAQVSVESVMDKSLILETLHRHFSSDDTPILVAIMKRNGDVMQEICRGMVVANSWPAKAYQTVRTSRLT
ncbi:DUF1853 family protein [Undibacterium fentianense]|uniref:DUF1853 family protein n=1 Tax=Undibacterium fentianense TaxID=2828728 RepID=A0A941E4Y3_9BURK|nr:DUF1853 family protein [Undibacterium fentianense]MBR7798863.1 DUF1853 family protein [Undibacterium fentianense]